MRRLSLISLLSLLLAQGCHDGALAPGSDLANPPEPDLLDPSSPDLASPTDLAESPDAGLVLNEKIVTVSGRVTVNGKTPTKVMGCLENRGTITFLDPAHDTTLFVTQIPCSSDDFSWSQRIAPGTYAVKVSYLAAQEGLTGEYVVEPHLAIGSDTSDLVLDLAVRTISGTVTVNGATPTTRDKACDPPEGLGVISFRQKDGSYAALVEVGCTGDDFTWRVTLPVGHYEIFIGQLAAGRAYGVNLLGAELPGYRVASDFVVDQDASGIVLNQIANTVSGTLLLNGKKPITNGATCSGAQPLAALSFFDPFTSQRFEFQIDCKNLDFAWSLALPAGIYRVSAQPATYAAMFGIAMPPGEQLIEPALAILGPQSNVVLDAVSFPVTGKVTVGGKTPVKKGGDCFPGSALLRLRFHDLVHDTNGYVTIPCETTDFAFSTQVAPGTYDVHLYATSSDVNIAGFEFKSLSALAVDAPIADLAIDQPEALGQIHHVAGSILKNGAPPTPPTCATDDMVGADVLFFDKQTGSVKQIFVPCKNNPTLSWSTTLPPGTYEVRVAGAYLPQYHLELSTARYIANAALIVDQDLSDVKLDQIVHEVSGVVQVNGATPTLNDALCVGRQDVVKIVFEDRAQDYVGYTLIDCATKDFSFSLPLPSGKYEVYLSAGTYATPFAVDVVGSAVRVRSGFIVP